MGEHITHDTLKFCGQRKADKAIRWEMQHCISGLMAVKGNYLLYLNPQPAIISTEEYKKK